MFSLGAHFCLLEIEDLVKPLSPPAKNSALAGAICAAGIPAPHRSLSRRPLFPIAPLPPPPYVHPRCVSAVAGKAEAYTHKRARVPDLISASFLPHFAPHVLKRHVFIHSLSFRQVFYPSFEGPTISYGLSVVPSVALLFEHAIVRGRYIHRWQHGYFANQPAGKTYSPSPLESRGDRPPQPMLPHCQELSTLNISLLAAPQQSVGLPIWPNEWLTRFRSFHAPSSAVRSLGCSPSYPRCRS